MKQHLGNAVAVALDIGNSVGQPMCVYLYSIDKPMPVYMHNVFLSEMTAWGTDSIPLALIAIINSNAKKAP
jgi:hypothetical protein